MEGRGLSLRFVFLSFCVCLLTLLVLVSGQSSDFSSNTILVTYKRGCLEELSRFHLVGRSVKGAVENSRSSRGNLEGVRVLRSEAEDHNLSVSSTISVLEKGKELEDEGGCKVEESWLKHAGLQVISLTGECERFGKEDVMERLAVEECVASREVDSPRLPSEMTYIGQQVDQGRALQVTANDPEFSRQWHLDDNNLYSIQAQRAWGVTMGGSGSVSEQPNNTVGIVDFGFMEDHPDLVERWWSNSIENCEQNGRNGQDEDGNGLADDCHGWNLRTNSNDLSGYSHGTKVAGCAIASTNNSVGIGGVCPNCRTLPATVSGSVSSELAGVNYILSKGVRVINLSVGGSRSEAELNTFQSNPNCLFVVSAGNESCNLDLLPETPCKDKYNNNAGYPASLSNELSNVVSVGAIDANGVLSTFSSFGATRVQVFAPGTGILTTSHSGDTPTYSSRSGTSYASPVVAGIAVMILQRYPTLAACQLRDVLVQSCNYNANLAGKAECNGQVSAFNALNVAETVSHDPTLYACPDVFRARDASIVPEDSAIRPKDIDVSVSATANLRKPMPHIVRKDGPVKATKVAKPLAKKAVVHSAKMTKPLPSTVKAGSDIIVVGEAFVEAIIAAFLRSGILVKAKLLETVVSLLLKLFANAIDPFAILTNGKPVKQYLQNLETTIGASYLPKYADPAGTAGPLSLLLNPLASAQQYLEQFKDVPLGIAKSGVWPFDIGLVSDLVPLPAMSSPSGTAPFLGFFGTDILDPLVLAKQLAGELLNLGGDMSSGIAPATDYYYPLGSPLDLLQLVMPWEETPLTGQPAQSPFDLTSALDLVILKKQVLIVKKSLALLPLEMKLDKLMAKKGLRSTGKVAKPDLMGTLLDPLGLLRGIQEAPQE